MFELSAGADGQASSWSTYSGLTAAILGDNRENGYRLRIGGGFGRYRYTRPFFDEASHRHLWTEFFGEQTWADILVGYQWSFGATTIKAFTGQTEEHHRLSPGPDTPLDADSENAIQGRKRGLKVVLETWTRLADWGFFQVDANWSEPFEVFGGRIRLGYFVGRGWSAGLESAAFGNLAHEGARSGIFGRYDWSGGEISISAGVDGDHERIGSGYASAGVTVRF